MAEADIHAPFRQEFDESTEMAGKPIPGFLCRVLVPEKTLLGTIHILCKHLKGERGSKNGIFPLFLVKWHSPSVTPNSFIATQNFMQLISIDISMKTQQFV